nr:MAG TPA: putative endonuclease [Caudoviricetes sp.]
MANIGSIGECIFEQRARLKGYEVKDLTGDKDYWEKDIDFLVRNPATNESRYIEVKTDLRLYETGNLYIELENTHSKEGKGWFNFSEADIIAYCNYGAPAKEIYLFSFDDLRTVIENGEWATAKCGADSKGLLVPLRKLKDAPSFRTI